MIMVLIFIWYEFNITVNLLIIKNPNIARYIKDFDADKYLVTINNKKHNSMLLKYENIWEKMQISMERKNGYIYCFFKRI